MTGLAATGGALATAEGEVPTAGTSGAAAVAEAVPVRRVAQAPALPRPIHERLRQAANGDGSAFLDQVAREAQARPDLADAIGRQAAQLRPDLAQAATRVAGSAGTGGATGGATGGGLGSLAGAAVVGVGAAGAAVAVGGGGGGGGDGGGGTPAPAPTPGDFETVEYAAGGGLGAINASTAYARGADGSGVIVGVLDSGIDPDHPDFAGRIAPGGYNFVDDSTDVEDIDSASHGTHVAGTVAASRNGTGMHGVAHGARVLPLKIFDSTSFTISDGQIATVIDHAAARGARVLNNSWGSALTIGDVAPAFTAANHAATVDAARRLIAQGGVLVWAAGNAGRADPSVRAGLPRDFADLAEQWLAVVSVDPDASTISAFSNRCGIAATWCVAAPGVGIVSTVNPATQGDSLYQSRTGTSMAAPHVAGAVAVLMDMFPNLSAAQVVAILKTTARDLGDPGVDAVYGHGLIDLARATQPVGSTSVALGGSVGGPSVPLDGSGMTGGSALGDAAVQALAGTTLVFTDGYDRPYGVDLGVFAATAEDRYAATSALPRFGRAAPAPVPVGDGFSLALFHDAAGAAIDGAPPNGFALTARSGGVDYAVGLGAPPSLMLRPADPAGPAPATVGDAPVAEALTRPFLSFADQDALTASVAWQAGGGRIEVTSLVGSAVLPAGAGEDPEAVGDLVAAMVDYSRPVGERASVTLGVGALSESETLLGTRGEGALALGGADTVFAGAQMAADLGAGLTAHAGWQVGLTRARGGDGSLVTGADGIRSDGWSLALTGRDGLVEGDGFGLALSQPLRVADGTLGLSVPVEVGLDGSVRHQAVEAGLRPSGREIDLQGWYGRALGPDADLAFGAAWRTDPGHVADAADELVGLMRLNVRF